MELNRKYRLAGLTNDDDWILNASYIDKTFLRHKICYDLFRQMSPNNITAKTAYIIVSENKKPQGIYLLTEEINGAFLGLNKSDPMAMLFKDPPILYTKRLKNPQDTTNYYQQKYPHKSSNDKTYYIEEFRTFLFHSTPQEFDQKIATWIDLDNVIDWHLLLLFTNNSDGIMKNFFLYKKDTNTPFRIAIWDYDHSFGRDGDNELNLMERPVDMNRSMLFKRLLESQKLEYKKALKHKWKTLRQSDVFSEKNIFQMMDTNTSTLKNYLAENFEIWPINGYWYYDDNTHLEEVGIMKTFIQNQLVDLDKKME